MKYSSVLCYRLKSILKGGPSERKQSSSNRKKQMKMEAPPNCTRLVDMVHSLCAATRRFLCCGNIHVAWSRNRPRGHSNQTSAFVFFAVCVRRGRRVLHNIWEERKPGRGLLSMTVAPESPSSATFKTSRSCCSLVCDDEKEESGRQVCPCESPCSTRCCSQKTTTRRWWMSSTVWRYTL